MFSPGRFDTLQSLYQDPNTDGNNNIGATEDDKKIVKAMREMEKNDMWISSLKANPRGSVPQFVTIVWSSLHGRISLEHDDDVILYDHDLDEGGNHGLNQKKAHRSQ